MSTQKLTYSTVIDAPRDLIWRVLLDDATYREWTNVFAEGSYADTDWQEGSKALFLGPTGDGMVSRIAVHRPNEHISIEHLGVVKNGVEELEGGAAEGWAGAHENYTLRDVPGGVELLIEMDSTPEYAPYFNETWPKALAKVKEISEARPARTA
jgi:uncharacterized protein YndB with AHSA1/START domain